MPIKKENKARYPKNWKEISEDIRFNRAGNKCEVCGVKNYSVGYWIENKFVTIEQVLTELETTGSTQIDDFSLEKRLIRIVLTVGHLDHTPENNDYSNLKAMCQKCHNSYDAPHRRQTFKQLKFAGQLKLEI